MNSVCFFSTYFNGTQIPYYVKYYLQQLLPHFKKVIVLTNTKNLAQSELDFLERNDIEIKFYKNEGMDFGMWHNAFLEYKEEYDRIGLINDSCVLFNSLNPFFNWLDNQNLDFAGMVLTGKIALHLQSYFLIINKNAIGNARAYFMQKGKIYSYKNIIAEYEIGLSQHLINNGFTIGGYINYSKRTDVNPTFLLAEEIIQKGCPLIKKKIISQNFYLGDYLTWFRNNFNYDYKYYINFLKKVIDNNSDKIDLEKVCAELRTQKPMFSQLQYNLGLKLYKLLSKSKLLKYVFGLLIKFKRKLVS